MEEGHSNKSRDEKRPAAFGNVQVFLLEQGTDVGRKGETFVYTGWSSPCAAEEEKGLGLRSWPGAKPDTSCWRGLMGQCSGPRSPTQGGDAAGVCEEWQCYDPSLWGGLGLRGKGGSPWGKKKGLGLWQGSRPSRVLEGKFGKPTFLLNESVL